MMLNNYTAHGPGSDSKKVSCLQIDVIMCFGTNFALSVDLKLRLQCTLYRIDWKRIAKYEKSRIRRHLLKNLTKVISEA